jgi:cell division protein FtsB
MSSAFPVAARLALHDIPPLRSLAIGETLQPPVAPVAPFLLGDAGLYAPTGARFKMQLTKFIGVGLAMAIPALAVAQLEGLRLDFQAGEPITAADINGNFSKLADEVTALRQQVEDLQEGCCEERHAHLQQSKRSSVFTSMTDEGAQRASRQPS